MKNLKSNPQLRSPGIYCILNLSNSKVYVGSSKNIYHRLRRHLSDLRKGNHHCEHLQNSFTKRGEDTFYSFVVEYCALEDLELREEYWIGTLKADYNKVLTNLSRPALSLSPERRLKLGESVAKAIREGRLSCNKQEVHVYDLQGNYLISFPSSVECYQGLGISKQCVGRVLSGRLPHSMGYQFTRNKVKSLLPVVLKKPKQYIPKTQNSKLKTVVLLDTKSGEELIFKSCTECADYFNTSWRTIGNTIKGGYLFRTQYRLITIKPTF